MSDAALPNFLTRRLPPDPRRYFAHLPRVETPRLLLRPLTMKDAPDMNAYASDPEVARHVLWDAHRSMSDTRAYLRFILGQYRSASPSSWGIILKETGRMVGTIGFMQYSPTDSLVEVGYSLARALWGQGLMTEALTAVLGQCFDVLRLHRVEAMHFVDNPQSGRVMEKCGMTHEGRLRGRVYNKGTFQDVEMWGILRRDWQKRAI